MWQASMGQSFFEDDELECKILNDESAAKCKICQGSDSARDCGLESVDKEKEFSRRKSGVLLEELQITVYVLWGSGKCTPEFGFILNNSLLRVTVTLETTN